MYIRNHLPQRNRSFFDNNKSLEFFSSKLGAPVLSGALICLLGTSLILGIIYIKFVPIFPDGGWYSYPGFALYQGRDPSENLLDPQILMHSANGVRSAFHWENRSNLLVLIHAMQFWIAGSKLLSVHIFGILQWFILAGLAGGAVWLVGRNRSIAILMTLLVLSDSWVISESLADLRPDIPIAIMALACLVAMLCYCLRQRTITAIVAGTFAAATLLIHSTGVIAFSACAAFACVYALLLKLDCGRLPWGLLFITIAGAAVFSLRQSLLDLFIPTTVPLNIESLYRHDLWAEIKHVYEAGITAKAAKELDRWADYFFISNAFHLIFLTSGLIAGLWALLEEGREKHHLTISLIAAFLAATAMITFFDPHFTSSHLVAVACIGYIAAAPGLSWILCQNRKSWRDWMIIAGVLAATVLKIAHGASLYSKSVHDGINNMAVERLLRETVKAIQNEGIASHLAIAPTSIWLYLPHETNLVLLDVRNRPWDASSPRWKDVSALVVDRDFIAYGWGKVVDDLLACGAARQIGKIGQEPGGDLYMSSLLLIGPGCRNGADLDR